MAWYYIVFLIRGSLQRGHVFSLSFLVTIGPSHAISDRHSNFFEQGNFTEWLRWLLGEGKAKEHMIQVG